MDPAADPADSGRSRSGGDQPGGLVEMLTRWLAGQRVDDAAAARSRERWLRQQAEEEGTFAGVLLDLGERDRPVVVRTVGDRHHRGIIRAVAGDFTVLSTEGATEVLLSFDGILSVRSEPRAPATVGDRTVALATTLADLLVGLAGERPRVLLVTVNGTATAGQLRAVGRDVITLRLDDEHRGLLYLALASVSEISILDR